jgi:hypothetical protein
VNKCVSDIIKIKCVHLFQSMCSVGTCPAFQVSMSMMPRSFSLNYCSDHECSGKMPCLFNEHTENFERIIMIF